MLNYYFEHVGNSGILKLNTFLNTAHEIHCSKTDDECFRLGGTAADSLIVKKIADGVLVEYYDLDMEGSKPKWIHLPCAPKDLGLLFVNVDIIDGGGNTLRRYRVSPYFGTYKVIEM